MKGTITRCLAELVETKWGVSTWDAVVADSGLERSKKLLVKMPSSDVPDADALALIASATKVLSISLEKLADQFGEYWCCTYAPDMYPSIVRRFSNAREMLLGMDQVHVQLTKEIPNATPPRFVYTWMSDNVLNVEYQSSRNLAVIYMGLARGVGKYFGEKLTVSETSPNNIQIRFSYQKTLV